MDSRKDENGMDTVVTRDAAPQAPRGPQNAKERLYERLRMPLWALDLILAALGVALVVCLVLGAIKGNAK